MMRGGTGSPARPALASAWTLTSRTTSLPLIVALPSRKNVVTQRRIQRRCDRQRRPRLIRLRGLALSNRRLAAELRIADNAELYWAFIILAAYENGNAETCTLADIIALDTDGQVEARFIGQDRDAIDSSGRPTAVDVPSCRT